MNTTTQTKTSCKHGHDEYLTGQAGTGPSSTKAVLARYEEERHKRDMTAYRAEQAEEREAQEREHDSHRDKIIAAAIAGGADAATTQRRDHKIFISGVDVTFDIDFSPRYSSNSHPWRGARAIGWRVTVGPYGERKAYPMKKDGTYSYDKIAGELLARAHHRDFQRAGEAIRKANAARVEALLTERGIDGYGAFRVDPSNSEGGSVRIKFEMVMTIARAGELHDLLVANGFITK